MKLINLIVSSVVLAMFSILICEQFSELKKLSVLENEIRCEYDSCRFISDSFRNVCAGKGFATFDEWKENCSALWNLNLLEWSCNCIDDTDLYYAHWSGPYGNGEVFYCMRKGI